MNPLPDFKPGELPPTGIYFGLSEHVYHAAPCLSASGIKRLTVSPLYYWATTPSLNPNAETERSDALDLGKAWHTRICEGKAKYDRLYSPTLDPADYPDALRTADQLKEALKAAGVSPMPKNKADMTAALLAARPTAVIWDVLVDQWREEHPEASPIDFKDHAKIELSAAMIEKHPDLQHAFRGGYPEVSIFWTDAETGCPMKARVDYLKTKAIVDLKTFANKRGKPIERAIAYAMAEEKYHVQAAVYYDAVQRAKDFIYREGPELAFGDVDLEWLESFASEDDFTFVFVFQDKGPAPIARGKTFRRSLKTYGTGRACMLNGMRTYMHYKQAFGSDPWLDFSPVQAFDDGEFPFFIDDQFVPQADADGGKDLEAA